MSLLATKLDNIFLRDNKIYVNLPRFERKVHLQPFMKREQWSEFNKAYVGVVENPGMTYNILEIFNIEFYFSLKVTPLEGNLCLLEEIEEGELFELVESRKDWLIKWFLEIYMWDPMDVDNERLTWLRVYGIPCHA